MYGAGWGPSHRIIGRDLFSSPPAGGSRREDLQRSHPAIVDCPPWKDASSRDGTMEHTPGGVRGEGLAAHFLQGAGLVDPGPERPGRGRKEVDLIVSRGPGGGLRWRLKCRSGDGFGHFPWRGHHPFASGVEIAALIARAWLRDSLSWLHPPVRRHRRAFTPSGLPSPGSILKGLTLG